MDCRKSGNVLVDTIFEMLRSICRCEVYNLNPTNFCLSSKESEGRSRIHKYLVEIVNNTLADRL